MEAKESFMASVMNDVDSFAITDGGDEYQFVTQIVHGTRVVYCSVMKAGATRVDGLFQRVCVKTRDGRLFVMPCWELARLGVVTGDCESLADGIAELADGRRVCLITEARDELRAAINREIAAMPEAPEGEEAIACARELFFSEDYHVEPWAILARYGYDVDVVSWLCGIADVHGIVARAMSDRHVGKRRIAIAAWLKATVPDGVPETIAKPWEIAMAEAVRKAGAEGAKTVALRFKAPDGRLLVRHMTPEHLIRELGVSEDAILTYQDFTDGRRQHADLVRIMGHEPMVSDIVGASYGSDVIYEKEVE